MPYYGLTVLYNLKHHTLPIANDNRKAGITGMPLNIDTGAVLIDSKNVDQFIRN